MKMVNDSISMSATIITRMNRADGDESAGKDSLLFHGIKGTNFVELWQEKKGSINS